MFKLDFKKIGVNVLWITALVFVIFTILIKSIDVDADIITLFFEIFMPMFVTVMISLSIKVLNDSSIKDSLVSSKSYFTVVLKRYLLNFGLVSLLTIVYLQVLLVFENFDLTYTLISYLVPSFFLSTISIFTTIIFKNDFIGITCSGFLWLIQLLVSKVLQKGIGVFFFLFLTYFSGVDIYWFINRLILLLVSIALWHFIYGLSKERKHIYDRGYRKLPIILGSVLILAIFVGSGYLWSLLTGVSSDEIEGTRDELWIYDISYLQENLPIEHKNLFFQLDENEFNERIDDIKDNVPELTDEEIKVELSKVIASIGDAHTSLSFGSNEYYPFSLYYFEEGVHLRNTIEEFKDVRYLKLIKINDIDINDILDELKEVISYENESFYKYLVTHYLVMPEVLKGLNITDSVEVNYTFVDTDGSETTITSKPIKSGEIDLIDEVRELPLYMQNKGLYYWYEHLEEDNSLYFKYDVCANMSDVSFNMITEEIFTLIEDNNIEKLIIDFRDNGGGNSMIFRPFLNKIKDHRLNDENRLFVIVGRNTFSSATINTLELRNNTNATFVGEPTGGKPNHYGEVRIMKLTNVGVDIRYSTNYFKYTNEESDSFYPDIVVEPSIYDYKNMNDETLGWILDR